MMSCEYCNETSKPLLNAYAADIYIIGNELRAHSASTADGHYIQTDSTEINFCPMCGERLGDDHE